MTKYAMLAVLVCSVFASVGCGFPKTGGAPSALSPAQASAASSRFPGVTEQSLKAGRGIFIAKCNGCHGYPDLGSVSADNWPDVMKRMAHKADLTDSQSDDALHFVLAARTEPVQAQP